MPVVFKLSDSFVNEPLTEEQKEQIPNPLFVLSEHVAEKGVQTGALLGNALGALLLIRTRPATAAQGLATVGRMGWQGAAVVTVLSMLGEVGLMQREGWNDYRIWDRAYRLQRNESQLRVDRFSLIGAGIGAVAMQHPALRLASPVHAALNGASIGTSLGVIAHVLTNPKEELVTATKKGAKAIETTVTELTEPKHPTPPPKH